MRGTPLWTAALIIMLLPGCDNVEWGGTQVAVVPPPPKEATPEAIVEEGTAEERPPTGPVLYYVQPAGATATLIPVGEIGQDTLLPIEAAADWETYGRRFIAEHLREGSEFALYRRGARIGTFVVQSAGIPAEGVCPRTPRATGVLELVPGTDQTPEFLALSKARAPMTERGSGQGIEPDRRMQLLSPILAERLLRARGAQLPGSWSRALVQLQPFPLAGAADPAFTSTFLVDDTLGTGFDDEGYSLFFIAQPAPQVGYDTVFVEFADYLRSGKAAPRVVDFLDWDRDGHAELLLQVYGTSDSWFEAVGRTGERWRRLLDTRCQRPAAGAAAGAASPAPPGTTTGTTTDAAGATAAQPPARRRATPPPALPTPEVPLATPPGRRDSVRPDTTGGSVRHR